MRTPRRFRSVHLLVFLTVAFLCGWGLLASQAATSSRRPQRVALEPEDDAPAARSPREAPVRLAAPPRVESAPAATQVASSPLDDEADPSVEPVAAAPTPTPTTGRSTPEARSTRSGAPPEGQQAPRTKRPKPTPDPGASGPKPGKAKAGSGGGEKHRRPEGKKPGRDGEPRPEGRRKS